MPAARGYDAEWAELRTRILKHRRVCERTDCGSSYRLNVHHVVSVKKAPERRLDPSNLQVLCHRCHSRLTALENRFGHRPGAYKS